MHSRPGRGTPDVGEGGGGSPDERGAVRFWLRPGCVSCSDLILLVTAAVSGCAGMTPTERRAATGTVMGAAGGAALGAIAGNAALGAGIGAGVGLLGGLLVDQYQKDQERAYQQGYQAGQSK